MNGTAGHAPVPFRLHYVPVNGIHFLMPTAIRAVIFDFGGVLGLPQDPARVAIMASLCGLSVEKFHTAYRRDRLELDRGTLPTEEYWRRILESGGAASSPDLAARIEREDSLAWTRTNGAVVSWGAELREAGYRTAILSNMPSAKLSFMRATSTFRWIESRANSRSKTILGEPGA